jgi:hypothetical protein
MAIAVRPLTLIHITDATLDPIMLRFPPPSRRRAIRPVSHGPGFVDGLEQRDEGIVRGLIDFARAMRLRMVAEGIEEPAQIPVLRAMGCDCGQGYFFARPGPASTIEGLLGGDIEPRRSPDRSGAVAVRSHR